MSKFIITKEVIDTIAESEMQSVKGMKKSHLFQLVRELIEDQIWNMDNDTIHELYTDIVEERL
jgi:hypothetical protein